MFCCASYLFLFLEVFRNSTFDPLPQVQTVSKYTYLKVYLLEKVSSVREKKHIIVILLHSSSEYKKNNCRPKTHH